MKTVLEFDSIEFSFGERRLLNSIYVVSETGSITGLLGRNGSGKSTLMKIVFGAIASGQKSVRINGASLGLEYLRERKIAYLPQNNFIPEYLTLQKAFSLFGIREDEIKVLFPEIADMMPYKPGELSGGYRRIVEVLLVLNSAATFCLLDEPFTGLTPVYIERIKEILHNAKATKGIIISDHMYKHVLDISSRLYVLVNGQTYPVNEPEQLISLGYVSDL